MPTQKDWRGKNVGWRWRDVRGGRPAPSSVWLVVVWPPETETSLWSLHVQADTPSPQHIWLKHNTHILLAQLEVNKAQQHPRGGGEYHIRREEWERCRTKKVRVWEIKWKQVKEWEESESRYITSHWLGHDVTILPVLCVAAFINRTIICWETFQRVMPEVCLQICWFVCVIKENLNIVFPAHVLHIL